MLSIYGKCFPHIVSTNISVRLHQKGLQFSCHQITVRNVNNLSLENVYLILFMYENKYKVTPKGMAVQLLPDIN